MVYGDMPEPMEAKDARLCRASGYFRRIDGMPLSGLVLNITPEFRPFVLDGSAVIPEAFQIQTNGDGFLYLDLIRHAKYAVQIEGTFGITRSITIPDRTSVNLPELLFPRLSRVEYQGEQPIRLRVGQTIDLRFRVFFTDGREDTHIRQNVHWTTGDVAVARIGVGSSEHITLCGVTPGETVVIANRKRMANGDPSVYYPDTPVHGSPIPVHVE